VLPNLMERIVDRVHTTQYSTHRQSTSSTEYVLELFSSITRWVGRRHAGLAQQPSRWAWLAGGMAGQLVTAQVVCLAPSKDISYTVRLNGLIPSTGLAWRCTWFLDDGVTEYALPFLESPYISPRSQAGRQGRRFLALLEGGRSFKIRDPCDMERKKKKKKKKEKAKVTD
jgi:hypothetical protein